MTDQGPQAADAPQVTRDTPDTAASGSAARRENLDDADRTAPLLTRLLAALVTLGRNPLWPGATPQPPPAQHRNHP